MTYNPQDLYRALRRCDVAAELRNLRNHRDSLTATNIRIMMTVAESVAQDVLRHGDRRFEDISDAYRDVRRALVKLEGEL